jgi:hypothetical protein
LTSDAHYFKLWPGFLINYLGSPPGRSLSEIFMSQTFKTVLSCIVLLQGVQAVFAQYTYYNYNSNYKEPAVVLDAGILVGGINTITDIGGNRKVDKEPLRSITFANTNFVAGAFLSATWKDIIAARLEYIGGVIEGADSLTSDIPGKEAQDRSARNLSFKTPIREFSLAFEFHPLVLWHNPINEPSRFSPYILAGIGLVSYEPKAFLNDRWVNLAPLRLEGQGFAEYPDRKIYKKTALSFPVGVGVRYDVSPLLYLRAEAGFHYTNTDYLDDVSQDKYVDPSLFYKYLPASDANTAVQLFNRNRNNTSERIMMTSKRGNPDSKDMFWTVMLKAGFVLNRKKL